MMFGYCENNRVLKPFLSSLHNDSCLVTMQNNRVLKPQNTVSARVVYIDLNDYSLNDISLSFSSQIYCNYMITDVFIIVNFLLILFYFIHKIDFAGSRSSALFSHSSIVFPCRFYGFVTKNVGCEVQIPGCLI